MSRSERNASDDFFCWTYRIWYRLSDCAFRHHWRTTSTCAACEQGRANLRLLPHAPARPRFVEILSMADEDDAAPAAACSARRRR